MADLTFRLQEAAADLGHLFCHVCGDLRLGRDGIAEVMAAAGKNGGFGDRFVSLHQNFFRHFGTSLFHCDDTIRTHGRAERAADALALISDLGR